MTFLVEIHKIGEKIRKIFCKLTFFTGKLRKYLKIFLNRSKITKFEEEINLEKVEDRAKV